MVEEAGKECENQPHGRNVLRKMYVLIALVAAVVIGSMGYVFHLGHCMMSVYVPLLDAAVKVETEVTRAHLWTEGIVSGDPDESPDDVLEHLNNADGYVRLLLDGGRSDDWEISLVCGPWIRDQVEQMRTSLTEFRTIAFERLAKPADSAAGSDIDRRCDAAFAGLLIAVQEVQGHIRAVISHRLARFRAVQSALIIACLAVTMFAGAIYSRLMHRQVEYARELQAANQQLDASNRQLKASEQQLRATNQQLQANEQQLRAANQQLLANEQQLRAANQQLAANEQQLRAANQQLVANEQQLRATNQQLIASEQQSRALAKFPSENPHPVLRLSRDCAVIYHNQASTPVLEAWGCKDGGSLRLPEGESRLVERAFETGEPASFDFVHAERAFSVTLAPVVESGYINVYALDITARKQAEIQLQKSLEEKEVLLREIHHRVKNNLQIIASLLSLQSDYVNDGQAVEMFRQSQLRVKSMALLHERLYRTEDLAHVNIGDYVRDLATELMASHGAQVREIGIEIDAEDLHPSINVAVPCVLIINELVSNCFKHAFPGGRPGQIRIALRRGEHGECTLDVGDDGVGFAKDADVSGGGTLGLKLVHALAAQLGGSVELDCSVGTTFRISFPGMPLAREHERADE